MNRGLKIRSRWTEGVRAPTARAGRRSRLANASSCRRSADPTTRSTWPSAGGSTFSPAAAARPTRRGSAAPRGHQPLPAGLHRAHLVGVSRAAPAQPVRPASRTNSATSGQSGKDVAHEHVAFEGSPEFLPAPRVLSVMGFVDGCIAGRLAGCPARPAWRARVRG